MSVSVRSFQSDGYMRTRQPKLAISCNPNPQAESKRSFVFYVRLYVKIQEHLKYLNIYIAETKNWVTTTA